MGLASKLGPPQGGGPSAPPMPGAPGSSMGGSAPPGYPQIGGQPQPQGGQQMGKPNQSSPYGLPPGASNPMGGPPQQSFGAQPGQYGMPGGPRPQMPGQSPGQPNQFPGQPHQFPGQPHMPGQHGHQMPGQPGQFPGQPHMPGQHGHQMPGQTGMPQGQFGGSQPFGQQPQQFGQPGGMQQQRYGGGAFSQQMVLQRLQKLVMENRLQHFYPPQRLDQVAAFVASKDVEGLGQRWRLPREVTADLVGLALYDICIYVDDSGSMAFEEGGERIDDMKAVLGRTADAATLFDTDGIVVRFMNSPVEGNGIHSEAEATNLIQQIRFSGTTPLGTNLDRKVLQPMVLGQARSGSMQKPVLVICITDGEPTGEPKETVRQVVLNAKNQLQNTPYGAGAVAFQFAQVGKDAAATRFLSALDVDPVIGTMIDCTSYYEQEQEEYARKGINLDPSLYLVKLMVGGIDRSYDEGDEG